MPRPFHESTLFLREFLTHFRTTGSLIPSSRRLARAMTGMLAERPDRPIRILECGAGTGAFTDAVLPLLRPGDTFDIVELNESFVHLLQQRLQSQLSWLTAAVKPTIHQMSLQEFRSERSYDFIISGLPHINFPSEIVGEILECYDRLLGPEGQMSYFEYSYIRPIRTVATLGLDRNRVRAVDRLMAHHLARHTVQRRTVLANLPPAWVQHLRKPNAVVAPS